MAKSESLPLSFSLHLQGNGHQDGDEQLLPFMNRTSLYGFVICAPVASLRCDD